MKKIAWAILAAAVLTWSCAHSNRATWTSIPVVQYVSRPAYTIQVEPLKRDMLFFVSFRLDIQNRGSGPLEVDWNDTRYIHNGKNLGVLVFRGIDPGTIRGSIQPDTVPAGANFSKEIFPLKTIAFLPRTQVPEPGRLGFEPGILPGGENSIRLALRQNGQKRQEILTVRLVSKPDTP